MIDFILNFVSIEWINFDSLIYPIIAIGLVMFAVSWLRILPFSWSFLLGIAGAIISSAAIFIGGINYQAAKEKQAADAFRVKIAELEKNLAEKKTETTIKYINKVKEIEVEKIVYVEAINEIFKPEIINQYPIPRGFVRVHDASASGNPLSSTTIGTDGEASTITIARASEVIVENYSNCRLNSVQLESLQEWIKTSQQLINK